jgi:hypothetical protein
MRCRCQRKNTFRASEQIRRSEVGEGFQARPTLAGPRLSGTGKEEEFRGAYQDERGSAAGGENAEAAETSVKMRRPCGRDGMGLMRCVDLMRVYF